MRARSSGKLIKKQRVIEAASGRQKADLVLKNATYVNVFSNEAADVRYRRGQRPDRGPRQL